MPAAVAWEALSRFCCKSLKTPGDKFPARRQNKPRSLIDVASGSLARSPVSLSPGDEVPHMFTRKPHPRLEEFAITCTKKTFATKSASCGLMHCNDLQTVCDPRHSITSSAISKKIATNSQPRFPRGLQIND